VLTPNVDPVRRTHSSQKQATTKIGSPMAYARSDPQQQCAILSRGDVLEAVMAVSLLGFGAGSPFRPVRIVLVARADGQVAEPLYVVIRLPRGRYGA
jgi:hypothetical protein